MLANISHFTGPYAHLNNPAKSISITRMKLARCVMMAGCNGSRSFMGKGIFRLIHLFSLVYANVKVDGGDLELDPSFHHLDQSEKIPVSYHLGTGLTKAFAEDYLNVPWLSHVSSYKSFIAWAGALASSKVSLHVPKKTKKAREPDLIGYDVARKAHILESKGYSSGFDVAVFQHAINQVSQVLSVSGTAPETRVACFHDFSETPFRSRIVDPTNNGGCKIEWSFEDCIKSYYAVFLENRNELRSFPFFGRMYKVLDMPKSDAVFGIDEEILRVVDEDIGNFDGVYNDVIKAQLNPTQRPGNQYAYDLGRDSILLLDRKRFDFPVLVDEGSPINRNNKNNRKVKI